MSIALNDLANVHLALCELLESPIITPGTRAQVEVLQEAIQNELEALKNADHIQPSD